MQHARTLMIMAGGTGGHIMPGLAVAHAMQQHGWRVVWLGNPARMEGRLVPAQGIVLLPLTFSGVRGKGVAALACLPFTLCSALRQAWRALRTARPDVVLGMGGYVAFPGGVVAKLRRIPLVIHEQNAIAGTAGATGKPCAYRIPGGAARCACRRQPGARCIRANGRCGCALPTTARRITSTGGRR